MSLEGFKCRLCDLYCGVLRGAEVHDIGVRICDAYLDYLHTKRVHRYQAQVVSAVEASTGGPT
jgi:hypothetical protein